MVYVDNKVALRQLEIANADLLAKTSLRAAEGTSLAKDGKFHPRVLTLVRAHPIQRIHVADIATLHREAITLSLFRFCVELLPSTGQ